MINSVDVVIIVSSLLAFVAVSMVMGSALIMALGWLLARMNDAGDPPRRRPATRQEDEPRESRRE